MDAANPSATPWSDNNDDIIFMQSNARYAYKLAGNHNKTHKYTIKMHKNDWYVSTFKTRWVRDNDDVLWFWGKVRQVNHYM